MVLIALLTGGGEEKKRIINSSAQSINQHKKHTGE
jgi:hypothetical protein